MRLAPDPFLTFAAAVIRAAEALLVVAAVTCAGLLLLSLLAPATLLTQLAALHPVADSGAVRSALHWVLFPVMAAMALTAVFLHLLARLVRSARDGTPFASANINRLRTMAWLAIAFTGAGLVADLARRSLDEAILGTPQALNFDIGGLVLALALFTLTQVFKTGLAMREELEGTV